MDWDIQVAAAGLLAPWGGEELRLDVHQNNLWCRPTASNPWAIDVTITDGNDEEWIFRRDPRVRCAWRYAILKTASGVPYLAPELQMLYKGQRPRPKDHLDAQQVLPVLDESRREFLRRYLPVEHEWQQLLV